MKYYFRKFLIWFLLELQQSMAFVFGIDANEIALYVDGKPIDEYTE